jgi:aminoglycoside phosphotransferase (APT) family kinase protein
MGLTMVDALAEISTVDWRSGDLAGIGRPEGFLERQVSRWSGQLDTYRTRELPGLDEVASWLVEERPEQRDSSLIHGDYSFFNVLFARNSDRLLAVIDWETATIGDPLLDLGGLLSNWANPGEEPLFWRSATGLAGMPTRAELADLYARRTGRDLTHLPFYMTLASFRLACILEGAYAKYRAGESEHELHAEFEGDVPRLIEHAADVIEGRFGVDG